MLTARVALKRTLTEGAGLSGLDVSYLHLQRNKSTKSTRFTNSYNSYYNERSYLYSD